MGYNRILTDTDREEYKPAMDRMYADIPEMAYNKIGTALVQQAFVYQTAVQMMQDLDHECLPNILSAGSYQDTAAELLRFDGISVYDVDPVINCDLHTYRTRSGKKYHLIISTSVLEHTTDDEEFIDDICKMLYIEGIAVVTMDFKDDWNQGEPVPYTSNRFYTKNDLLVRLRAVLHNNNCELIDEPNYDAKDTFVWDGIQYSFATYVFRKA